MRGHRHTIQVSLFSAALAVSFLCSPLIAADRKDQENEAVRQGREETKKVEESREQHNQSKLMHLQKAEQARQRQDEGTAQQEEQMAMMEQMKVQQLQQQVDANHKSADQNEAGAKKLKQDDEPTGKQKNGYNPDVRTVRNGEVPAAPGQKESPPTETTPVAASPELADLSGFTRDLVPQAQPQAAAPEPSAPKEPAAQTINHLLGDLEKMDRASVVFQDGAKAPSSGAQTASGETPQYRLLTSASGNGSPSSTSVSGSPGSGSASGSDSNIWGAPKDEAAAKATRGGRAFASAGLSSSSEKAGGSSSLGALDKDFFDACPTQKEWNKMSKQARDEVRSSCRKTVKKCEKEVADAAKKAKKGQKKELSAACREWQGEKKTEADPEGRRQASSK